MKYIWGKRIIKKRWDSQSNQRCHTKSLRLGTRGNQPLGRPVDPQLLLVHSSQVTPMFNIEVFNTCRMTFWPSNRFFFWVEGGALHKYVFCKLSTIHNEGLSKNCLSQNRGAAICKKHSRSSILALQQTLPCSNDSCNLDSATSTWH